MTNTRQITFFIWERIFHGEDFALHYSTNPRTIRRRAEAVGEEIGEIWKVQIKLRPKARMKCEKVNAASLP